MVKIFLHYSNYTIPKTILYIPLNKSLAITDRDNDSNNHIFTNVSDPMNDSVAAIKTYVDPSGLKQDRMVTETSLIIRITIGELSFPLVTKQYVDKFMYNVLQTILVFTKNS